MRDLSNAKICSKWQSASQQRKRTRGCPWTLLKTCATPKKIPIRSESLRGCKTRSGKYCETRIAYSLAKEIPWTI